MTFLFDGVEIDLACGCVNVSQVDVTIKRVPDEYIKCVASPPLTTR